MKKFRAVVSIMVVLTITIMAAFSVYAADPFTKITMTPDTQVLDDTADQGANGKPIQYVENFGIGYTYIGDCVVLPDLDFGTNGAKDVTISFTNAEKAVDMAIILDNKDSEPVATIKCDVTAGWDAPNAKDFTAALASAVTGKHTVYVKWLNGTGSLFAIQFSQASEVADTAAEPEAADSSAAEPEAGDNPKTGDSSIIFAVVTAAASLGGMRFARRKA